MRGCVAAAACHDFRLPRIGWPSIIGEQAAEAISRRLVATGRGHSSKPLAM
jgi:hypothetical protein